MDPTTDDLRSRQNRAMDLVGEALAAKDSGDAETHQRLITQALTLEEEVARRSRNPRERAVLFRSAASIALEAGYKERARQLIDIGLAGSPPDVVREELMGLLRECDGTAT